MGWGLGLWSDCALQTRGRNHCADSVVDINISLHTQELFILHDSSGGEGVILCLMHRGNRCQKTQRLIIQDGQRPADDTQADASGFKGQELEKTSTQIKLLFRMK